MANEKKHARSTPAASFTSRQARIDQVLAGICDELHVQDRAVDSQAVSRATRRFGTALPQVGAAGALMIERCPGPFRGVTTAADLGDKAQHLEALLQAEAAFEAARKRLRGEINYLRATVGDTAGALYDACQFTLRHPAWPAEEKARLDVASKPFRAAIEGRRAGIAASARQSRARNSALSAERAESQARAARLELENRYLSGEQLRPADLTSPGAATPTAPRLGRRKTSRR